MESGLLSTAFLCLASLSTRAAHFDVASSMVICPVEGAREISSMRRILRPVADKMNFIYDHERSVAGSFAWSRADHASFVFCHRYPF
jgi:hypothetical protein